MSSEEQPPQLDRPLRGGVIGVGLLGESHARFLHQGSNGRTKLVAAADTRPDTAERVASSFGCRAYSDYESLLETEDLDLVFVATPDPLHREPVIACAQAGIKHIVLQKPMATAVADAEAMLAAAEAAGSTIYLLYANRAIALDMACHYGLRSGLIGEPVYADVCIEDNIGVPTIMWEQRSRSWAAGSSTAHFLITHLVDRLRWYLAPAEVAQVQAMVQRRVLGYTPDLYDAFLRFTNGVKARVKAGWINYIEVGVESEQIFNGSRGQIIHNRSPRFGTAMGWRANVAADVSVADLEQHQDRLHQRGLPSRLFVRQPGREGWDAGVTRGLEIGPVGLPQREYCDFIVDAIVEGTTAPASWRAWQGDGPLPTGPDGLAVTRVCCAIVDAADQQTLVDVPLPGPGLATTAS